MREIDRKLIDSIKNNRPLREIKNILKEKPNLNIVDENGRTVLINAIYYQPKGIQKFILN